MGDGFNFQQLKDEILKRSQATKWEVAKREWSLANIRDADEPETCLCGHFPIIELCTIANATTGKSAEVGNVCVKRFFGFRTDLIFKGLKRIRKSLDNSVGPDATALFHQRSVINAWEYGFQQDTMRKRNLSPRQLDTRHKINRKILASFARSGLE